jgi:hypothetical protein
VTWSARLAGFGVALAGLLALAAALVHGGDAAVATACGSVLALVAQTVAVALLRPAMGASTTAFLRRWTAGLAIRGTSLVLLGALMLLTRQTFPILWMAGGYLGVLLPLLFMETRFLT